MNRRCVVPCVLTFFLAGCSSAKVNLQNTILEEMQEKSGVFEDEDYQKYEELKNTGKLDLDGYVIGSHPKTDTDDSEEVIKTGTIHVTLSHNNHLDVQYYLDEDKTKIVDNECWLNPGDSLYYSYALPINVKTDFYSFDTFKIYSYLPNRTLETRINTCPKDNVVFTVPDEYNGTELSVEPIGKYSSRTLTLNDYFVDVEGISHDARGKWIVNKKVVEEDIAFLSPTVDCNVSYQYDPNQYYVSETRPQFFSNPEGIIHFDVVSPRESTSEFAVKVKEYTTVTFDGSVKGISKVWVNDIEQKLSKNSLIHLRQGDQIKVEVKDKYVAGSNDLFAVDNPKSNEYLFEVPDSNITNMSIIVTSSDSTVFEKPVFVNGSVSVVYADTGIEIADGNIVSKDTRITVKVTPNDGYYISGNKVKEDGTYSQTMKYSELSKNIQNLAKDHAIKKIITIYVDTNDPYGSVKFISNGKEINSSIKLKSEETIKIEYKLEDKNYRIVHKDFINNMINNSSTSREIKISEEMDGTTLKREDYIELIENGD